MSAAISAACVAAPAARADTASAIETLKRLVAEQQKRIEALERQLSNSAAAPSAAAPTPVAAAAQVEPRAEPRTARPADRPPSVP